jgi:transcriptional regulator with XRE-family HTH domain
MIVGVKVREVRDYRRLRTGELARLAAVSDAGVSLIEKGHRVPRVDTLQKLAAALEVSSSYLLSEEDTHLPLHHALARQTLRIFMREAKLSNKETQYVEEVSALDSAPDTVKAWQDLIANLRAFKRSDRSGARGVASRLGARRTYVASKPVPPYDAVEGAREKKPLPSR